ncbi:MAG: FG-GAP repeat domain-containing protein [Planctomycetota bacterium]
MADAQVTLEPAPAVDATETSPTPYRLQYTESSAGLNDPRFENGRTILKFADLNLDGFKDIVTVGDHGSPFINTNMHGITVWFGDGGNTWTPSQTGIFGYGGVAIGDVNSDGLPDVGWGVHHDYGSNGFGDRVMGVALGDGTGRNWTPWDTGLGQDGQSWGMFATEFADVDVDGDLDIASVAFGCCDGFHVYLNNEDGTWTRSFGWLNGNSSMELAAGDVNNDGWIDFAVSHGNGAIWINDRAGGFTRNDTNLPLTPNFGLLGLDLGDVNGDGHDDLSFASRDGGVEMWVWDPATETWVDGGAGLPDTGVYSVTRLVDMNFDGLRDYVAFGSGRLVIWLNDGGGTWVPEATFTVGASAPYEGFAVADVDRSGRPDILILSEQGGFFSSRNKLQFFRESATPSRLAIAVTDPTPNRVLQRGRVTMINWNTAVPSDSETSTVKIELSLDGQNGPWIELASGLLDNGTHQFVVDAPRASDNVWIRAEVESSSGNTARAIHGPLEIR